MSDIVVLRGGGFSQGADVIDPLVSSDHACMARGRAELDAASGLHSVQLDCLYRSGLLLGQLVEMTDPATGMARYGKITSITFTLNGTQTDATFRLTVPSEFLV